MKTSPLRFIFIILISSILSACSPSAPLETASTLNVAVSILPEKYFVERIGGEDVSVSVMAGPGDSPHTYEPKPDQMAALSRSSIYFRIGVEFEDAWMSRIGSSNPKMKIIDLSENVDKLKLTDAETEIESHGEADPHIWTSLANGKKIAETIYKALELQNPANSALYKANYDALIEDIIALDKEIHTSLDSLKNRKFMVFHPGWAYFARDYDLEEIAIEIGGTEPSASELAALLDKAKAENIRVVFAQPEFSTQIAEYIAKEIGGEVVLISPLAEDWLENLREITRTFRNTL